MKKAIFAAVALILVFVLGSNGRASDLQMSIIPADTHWVFHLDLEKYASSLLFKLSMDEEGAPQMHRKAGVFFEKFRLDPLRDIRSITLFGRGDDTEEPVVVLSGNFDKTYLLGLLKLADTHGESSYGKYTIYSWGKKHSGVFVTDNLVFFSQSEDGVKLALDAVEGKIKNISSSPLFARLKRESPGAILLAAGADIPKMLGARGKPVILSKMKTASFSIAEIGEMVNLKIDIAAESSQVAKDIEQAIRGLIAMVNLQLADRLRPSVHQESLAAASSAERRSSVF